MSALLSIDEVRPAPIRLRDPRALLLVLTDESGPIGGSLFVGPEYAQASLRTCRSALFSLNARAREAVSLAWAEKPADYTPMGCDVLLVQVPGTHELPKRRQRRAPKSHRSGMALLALQGFSVEGRDRSRLASEATGEPLQDDLLYGDDLLVSPTTEAG